MKIELTDLKENAYVNFIESKQSYQTRRNYTRDLEGFLKLIPEHIHVDYVNTRPMRTRYSISKLGLQTFKTLQCLEIELKSIL